MIQIALISHHDLISSACDVEPAVYKENYGIKNILQLNTEKSSGSKKERKKKSCIFRAMFK